MPNFRSDKKNYNNNVNHQNHLKIKKTFINHKRHNDFIDITETEKWIKVSYKTNTTDSISELLRELEEIVFRYNYSKSHFQAINPIFSDGRLDFYLNVSRSDSKVLFKNYSSIRRFDIKCMTFNDLHMPHVFPQDWINLLMPALDKRFSKNESTGETEVDLSDLSNDSYMKERGLILKMSNAHVMKHVLNMFKETNLKSITKLNLSNNEISNIFQLELFFEYCTVSKVDLSNNRLNHFSDLRFMSKNNVIELNLSNNDFTKNINTKQLQEEIRKIIPALRILNGKTLPESVIIAGETSLTKKRIPDSIFSDKNLDVYTQFLSKYCHAFDDVSRDALCEFYTAESIMSLDCYSNDMPQCYKSINSNIYLSRSNETSSVMFKKGKASIVGTFVTFPKTKHIEDTLNIDIAFRTLTDMMFILTGTFVELPEKNIKSYRPRQFSRTFIINNGIILQDHLSLLPTDSNLYQKFKSSIEKIKEQHEFPERYKEDLKNISAEAIEIVRQFKLFTCMTVKACIEFLSFVNNLSEATEKFTTMKEQGSIPNEAYDFK